MNYISEAHKEFYNIHLQNVREQDCYHKALIYCLGICADTRRNINRIYDFKTGYIKPECLNEGWQTSGTARVVRMAFNLYCNAMPGIDENSKNLLQECRGYTVEDLFCCDYAPFFFEAIKLRYPEYIEYNYELHAMLGSRD